MTRCENGKSRLRRSAAPRYAASGGARASSYLTRMSHFVSHLEAAIDGTVIPFGSLVNTHAGRPIWVRYHLDRVRPAVTPADIAKRPPSLWRYRELLPLPSDVEPVPLGEGTTP